MAEGELRRRGRGPSYTGAGRRLGALFALTVALPAVLAHGPLAHNPRGAVQETIGAAIAATSSGHVRHLGDVTLYEECRGACSLLKLVGPNSVTFGHYVFTERTLDTAHLRHELVHVRQSQELGLLWIPAYIVNSVRLVPACRLDPDCYYQSNPFEVEALEAEQQGTRPIELLPPPSP